MTGYVPAWAAFLTGLLVLLFGGSFGVWLGFGLGLEHAERAEPEWTAAELEWLADQPRFRRPPVEIAHERDDSRRRPIYRVPGPPELGPIELDPVAQRLGLVSPEVAHDAWAEHERQALAVANSGSDEERVAAAMADLDVFMTRLLADHPEEGP
jgi:hypothetical protein